MDWHQSHNLILTGGEDCRYKVWDSFGRCLFASGELEFPVTAARWSPSGEWFALGSFDSILLCDKMGWYVCQGNARRRGQLRTRLRLTSFGTK